MSSNYQVTKSGEARIVGASACYRLGSWEGHPDITTVDRGPKQAFRVSDMHGCPSTPGVWGHNWARISSEKCHLLLHLLFIDVQGRVDAFIQVRLVSWRNLLLKQSRVAARGELCFPEKICLINPSWGCLLALRMPTFRGAWCLHLCPQLVVILLFESLHLVKQRLHLPIILSLAFLHPFTPGKVVFVTHN